MTAAIRLSDCHGWRILFLAHSNVFGPFRVGSHHYARTLARAGADVVHLSTPVSAMHRATGRISQEAVAALPRGAYRDSDEVTHLVPRTMLPRPYGPFRVERALHSQGLPTRFDAVLIDQPLLWDESVRTLAPRLLYRPTDLYPSGQKASLQRRILDQADGVIATSHEVLRALGPLSIPTLALENGVDIERFTFDASAEPRPAICVYVGALDGRFDGEQLRAWAQRYPDVRFVIAGPHTGSPETSPTNIEMPGVVPYDQLPALLRTARVGLLPLSDNPINAGRSPMKLYEYLGSGLAVVARETPVIHADHAAGMFTYTGVDDADDALEQALRHRSPNISGAQRAASKSWEAKTTALWEFIGGMSGH